MVSVLIVVLLLVLVLGIVFYAGRALGVPEPVLVFVALIALIAAVLSATGDGSAHGLHIGR